MANGNGRDPWDDYVNQYYSEPERSRSAPPRSPYRAVTKPLAPLDPVSRAIEGVAGRGAASHAASGVAQSLVSMGRGALNLLPGDPGDKLLPYEAQERARTFFGEPETTGQQVAQMGGRFAAEALPYAAATAIAPQVGVPAAVARYAPSAAKLAGAAAKAAPRTARLAKGAAIAAPVDVAMSESGEGFADIAETAGRMYDMPTLQKFGEAAGKSFPRRAATEIGLGNVLPAAATMFSRGKPRPRPTLDDPETIAREALEQEKAGGRDITGLLPEPPRLLPAAAGPGARPPRTKGGGIAMPGQYSPTFTRPEEPPRAPLALPPAPGFGSRSELPDLATGYGTGVTPTAPRGYSAQDELASIFRSLEEDPPDMVDMRLSLADAAARQRGGAPAMPEPPLVAPRQPPQPVAPPRAPRPRPEPVRPAEAISEPSAADRLAAIEAQARELEQRLAPQPAPTPAPAPRPRPSPQQGRPIEAPAAATAPEGIIRGTRVETDLGPGTVAKVEGGRVTVRSDIGGTSVVPQSSVRPLPEVAPRQPEVAPREASTPVYSSTNPALRDDVTNLLTEAGMTPQRQADIVSVPADQVARAKQLLEGMGEELTRREDVALRATDRERFKPPRPPAAGARLVDLSGPDAALKPGAQVRVGNQPGRVVERTQPRPSAPDERWWMVEVDKRGGKVQEPYPQSKLQEVSGPAGRALPEFMASALTGTAGATAGYASAPEDATTTERLGRATAGLAAGAALPFGISAALRAPANVPKGAARAEGAAPRAAGQDEISDWHLNLEKARQQYLETGDESTWRSSIHQLRNAAVLSDSPDFKREANKIIADYTGSSVAEGDPEGLIRQAGGRPPPEPSPSSEKSLYDLVREAGGELQEPEEVMRAAQTVFGAYTPSAADAALPAFGADIKNLLRASYLRGDDGTKEYIINQLGSLSRRARSKEQKQVARDIEVLRATLKSNRGGHIDTDVLRAAGRSVGPAMLEATVAGWFTHKAFTEEDSKKADAWLALAAATGGLALGHRALGKPIRKGTGLLWDKGAVGTHDWLADKTWEISPQLGDFFFTGHTLDRSYKDLRTHRERLISKDLRWLDNVQRTIKNLPEAADVILSRAVDEGEGGEQLIRNLTESGVEPQAAAEAAQVLDDYRSVISTLGQSLVDSELLHPEAFAKLDKRYAARLYEQYNKVAQFEGRGGRKIRLKGTDRLMRRKDEVSSELTPIESFKLRSAVTVADETYLAATEEFFRGVRGNPQWTHPEFAASSRSLSDMRKLSASIDENIAGFGKARDLSPEDAGRLDQLQNDKKSVLVDIAEANKRLNSIKEGIDPNVWKELPDTKKLGSLSGQYVKEDVFRDVENFSESRKAVGSAIDIYDRALRYWKRGKTWANPATWMRNVVGAQILGYIGDGPMPFSPTYHDAWHLIAKNAKRSGARGQLISSGFGAMAGGAAEMYQDGDVGEGAAKGALIGALGPMAVRKLRGKPRAKMLDQMYKEAEDLGVMEESFSSSQLADIGRRYEEDAQRLTRMGKVEHPYKTGIGKGWQLTKEKGRQLGEFYHEQDIAARLAYFIDARTRRGLSPEEAAAESKRWVPTYEDLSKVTQAWGRLVPFFAYTAKALPRYAESFSKNPLRAVQIGAMAYALEELLFEEDVPEEVLPTEMRGPLEATPAPDWAKSAAKFAFPTFVPFSEQPSGARSYLDFTYILPYGDIAEGRGTLPNQFNPLSGPVMQTGAALATNRDPFTRRDIVTPSMTDTERLQARTDYLAKQALPSLTPQVPGVTRGGWSWERLVNAGLAPSVEAGEGMVLEPREGWYGEVPRKGGALATSLGGMKQRDIVPIRELERRRNDITRAITDLKSRARSAMRNPGLSENQKRRMIEDMTRQNERLVSQLRELMDVAPDVPRPPPAAAPPGGRQLRAPLPAGSQLRRPR